MNTSEEIHKLKPRLTLYGIGLMGRLVISANINSFSLLKMQKQDWQFSLAEAQNRKRKWPCSTATRSQKCD